METTTVIQKVSKNPSPDGRDWIVGDVHGCFNKLSLELAQAGFDAKNRGDRLFFLGDLIDRGPDCLQVLEWLDKPWVYAIAGNHEDLTVLYNKCAILESDYIRNGGDWFVACEPSLQTTIARRFQQLPLAIELDTANGPIGLVHANVPYGDWDTFKKIADLHGPERYHCHSFAQWDRSRLASNKTEPVTGIRAVIVGHSVVQNPRWVANVLHIDTGGWLGAHRAFTFIDAKTLQDI